MEAGPRGPALNKLTPLRHYRRPFPLERGASYRGRRCGSGSAHWPTQRIPSCRPSGPARTILLVLIALLCSPAWPTLAQSVRRLDSAPAAPAAPLNDTVTVAAVRGQTWQDGIERVLYLDGPCEIRQGNATTIQADRCVLWYVTHSSLPQREVVIYAEGVTRKSLGAPMELRQRYLGRLTTSQPVQTNFAIVDHSPEELPTFYRRALLAREPTTNNQVKLAQFVSPQIPSDGNTLPAPGVIPVVPEPAPPGGGRRIKIVPRSSVPLNISSFLSPDQRERTILIDSGANIVIDGVPTLGTIDIATDRLVIWTNGAADQLSLSGNEGQAPADVPLEFYMEGNIVFRTGERVIYANSMYYDVRGERGVVLDAELLSNIPQYAGLVRLKADVLRQLGPNRFQAHDAAFTSSRLGLPKYWFQAESLSFEEVPTPLADPITGQALVDPLTGEPAVASRRLAESRNNYVFVGGVPVFYWPKFSTDLTNPKTFIRRARIGNDRVFGTQLGLSVDVKQILGISDRAPTVDWTGAVDYLSKRGWGGGTTVEYQLDRVLGLQGPTRGFLDAWFIHDNGLDNLGADRRAVPPETDDRGRILWQHRQRLPNGLQITGQLGWVSDRNFLEEYYEHEWDEWKDQTTGVELKWLGGNSSWNLAAEFRINDFFTQTEWLPGFDQYQLGQSLFGDRATWFGHSQIGYARMRAADPPTDPAQLAKFNPLAWEGDFEGIRVGGRHEIDAPFQLGAVKVVPYALGEVMHWGQDSTPTIGHGCWDRPVSAPVCRCGASTRPCKACCGI